MMLAAPSPIRSTTSYPKSSLGSAVPPAGLLDCTRGMATPPRAVPNCSPADPAARGAPSRLSGNDEGTIRWRPPQRRLARGSLSCDAGWVGLDVERADLDAGPAAACLPG